MQFLTVDDVLRLHALTIVRFGGSEGLRDVGRLESAIATQHQSVFGVELYATPHHKAAAMIRGIIADHPFVDGNKRTALLTGLTFIEMNGLRFVANKQEIEDYAVYVATHHPDIDEIATWLDAHTTPTTP